MPATTASTQAIYSLLISRFLDWVPAGPVMPHVSLRNGALGSRVWIVQPPDGATFPFVVVRLGQRVGSGATFGLIEQFTFEVDVWNRPRTLTTVTAVQLIADQIQAALIGYRESTAPVVIRETLMRQTYPVMTSPADRDVIREYLSFGGQFVAAYMSSEAGH